MVGPAIVELARAAVRRLADAAPAAREARAALARIERVGLGPPYTVAIAGDPAARSALLDAFAGEHLFDPARREPDRIVLQIRRGAVTTLRARRRDGSVEDRALDAEPAARDGGDDGGGRDRGGGGRSRRAGRHDDRAATVAATDDPAFRDAIVMSAEAETTAMVRQPPWWAVWRRIAAWWRARRTRRAQAALAAGSPAGALPASTSGPAPARRGLAATVARAARASDLRADFAAALAACLADDAVEKLFVEVGGGPLSDKVVVIELPSGANALSLDAVAADTCVVACGGAGFAMTEQLEIALDVVPHLFAVGGAPVIARGAPGGETDATGRLDPRIRRLDLATAAGALDQLAMRERALAVGGRALAALATGMSAIDAAITRAETAFRARLDRLEAMRIASPDDHVAAALARIRPGVVDHVKQLLRDALAGLDTAIGDLGAAWSAQLAAAAAADALRTAAAEIDEGSPAALATAQAAAHRALIDGLTERARAHYDELIGELRRGTSRDDAAPPWLTAEVAIAELTSSTSLGSVAPRLTSLFRSLAALRDEAIAQLDQRIARLRQLASASLLDTEPRLEPAVTGVVAIALRAEVERHAAWLEAELARERVAIEAERVQLAGYARIRDAARGDERALIAALDQLTAELP